MLALNSIVEVDVAGAVHIYSFGYFICSRGRFFLRVLCIDGLGGCNFEKAT